MMAIEAAQDRVRERHNANAAAATLKIFFRAAAEA
jgi:hypothetical protein